MYGNLGEDNNPTRVIGSFSIDKNVEFKEGFKYLVESFKQHHSLDPIDNLVQILKVDVLREDYKDKLLGDINMTGIDDPYYLLHEQKIGQLFENSALEIIIEAMEIGNLSPIVGISLPVLKKNYLECHGKDIMMVEIPTKPIIKHAFERKFLKDKVGTKYYIPEIFYDGSYRDVVAKTRGKEIVNTWFPEAALATLPFQDLAIMGLSGGSLETRDSLALDFCVEAVQIKVGETVKTITGLNIQDNLGANNTFNFKIRTDDGNGGFVEDILMGQVDRYRGTVSVACTGGLITKVRFGGHLSNENNTETVELDKERIPMEWKIPDGQRINTGLTIEKIKDNRALFDTNITAEIITDMSTVLTQFEDSNILDFLENSFNNWKDKTELPFGYKGGFVETSVFNCLPQSSVHIPISQWINSELKFYMTRLIDELKTKLKISDVMFVVFGNPSNITLIQDTVKWVIDEDTKIGGVQLEYRFGVLTSNKSRIHVVSSLKVDRSLGLRLVAFPLTKETITFKHYKYSLNIENVYRNPMTPLTPNVMGTSRFLTTEVLPVQGKMVLKNNDFGIDKFQS